MQDFLERNIGIISEEEQGKISKSKVALLGLGAGSVIAGLLVRLGVEHLLIADGDTVSKSNLNRQLYVADDVGSSKTSRTEKALKAINPKLDLTVYDSYLSDSNLPILKGYNVIVDTIDLSAVNVIMSVHSLARQENIPVIFPINLGWKSMVTVFDDKSETLDDMLGDSSRADTGNFSFWATFLEKYVPEHGLEKYRAFLDKASKMEDWCPAPQIGATVYATASLVTTLLAKIVNDQTYTHAPKFDCLDLFRPEIE
ncbi:MAG: ThiF family adenylyltransferase [Patescibacteria group bacterium]